MQDVDGPLPDTAGELAGFREGPVAALVLRSMLSVPLRFRDKTIGAILVANDDRRAAYDSHAVPLLTELAARAGLMLESTQAFTHEHAAAVTLQRSLLPRLIRIEGVEIAAT